MKFAPVLALLTLVACGTTPSAKPLDASATSAGIAMRAGLAKVERGEEADAIADFSRAIELDPLNAEAWRWRGHCLNKLKFYEDSLPDYDRAIELDPTDSWSHYARAMAQFNLGHHDAALAGYTRSLELDPKRVKALDYRGLTRQLVGDQRGASADFDRSIALVPNNPWTHVQSAKAHQALDDLDACERALVRGLELDPSNPDALLQHGFSRAVLGDSSGSISELEKAAAAGCDEQAYARLWIWMQRADRERAELELREWFRDASIDNSWQQRLVSFVLGDGTDELLAARAREETTTRLENGLPRDSLECEAAFYAGLRHEFHGERQAALALFERARTLPSAEAWEWHMAAVRARKLAF